jgi:3-methyladenine DNA glycosylase AlkD
MPEVESILKELRALSRPTVPDIRRIARHLGRSQGLAERLWDTGVEPARVLATLVADPAGISRATMDRWIADVTTWHLCDACCYDLFDRTPHAWPIIRKWAKDDREFVRRAAFATIAAIAKHDKAAPDQVFLEALPLIEKYAFDNRNFVRKGVNWALRNIGKRNPSLRPAAIQCAERIKAQGTSAARWIASDALREPHIKIKT